jgi:hypothetical protein
MSRTFNKDHVGGPAWRVSLLGALLALVLVPVALSAQSADDKYRQNRDRNSRFNLNASATTVLRVNQYQCGLSNDGDNCTDVFNSPTGGGGFWPTGSPNQYMFNAGLQITGIIPLADNCTNKNAGSVVGCFPWAGDTTGAFLVSLSGTTKHGAPLSNIYDSLTPEDLDIWPCVERNGIVCDGTPDLFPDFPFVSAMVEDTSLFNDVLIGRKAASQQDTWVMYWDGEPANTGGRTHPMGILVEQRTLAWNYPAGNESVIYFIYKITNVTNNALFQRLSEERYFGGANRLPNEGWRLDSIYVTYVVDPDVTPRYQFNYATASFPFNLGYSYDGTFFAPEFEYSPALHPAPFFPNAPGIVGVKYLKSPIDPATGEEVGLTAFSLNTNGNPFPDPATVARGWRYHSLNLDPGKGDAPCTFPLDQVKALRSCYLAQVTADVRWFQASGPFSLDPGASVTVALAQYVAPTVSTPLITRGTNERNVPGLPTLAPGCFGQPIRPIDVAIGYPTSVPAALCPEDADETIDQYALSQARLIVPGSLLGRAMVAQSIFDNKFLLGFAPETPSFYLVPGSNRVTVMWEPSATERTGDPFYAATSDPTNPLYDPNYRQFDVEGYRIYRGTSPSNMKLIAQFDKNGTTFRDVLCVTDDAHVTGTPCTAVREVPISHPFVQYTTVAKLASGDAIVLGADTALAEQVAAGTSFELSDTGIPFAYVDNDVRNGFQYFYRVTAFDINSVRSGPSSLESAGPFRSTVPVQASPNLEIASFRTFMAGADGKVLDPTAAVPTIHPEHGTFSGPMPPANSLEGTFAPLVERLLPKVRLEMRIDSVKMGYLVADCPAGRATTILNCWTMYLTVNNDGVVSQVVQDAFTATWAAFGGGNTIEYMLADARVLADATSSRQFGIPAGSVGFNAALNARFPETIGMSGHLGQANSRGGNNSGNSLVSPIPAALNLIPGGSRWFAGTNETEPDPTRLMRSGHIPGIDTIFSPTSPAAVAVRPAMGLPGLLFNNACFGYSMGPMMRAADVQFRWGTGGAAQVFDVTHNVPVPFKPSAQASYGFLVTDANGNGVIDYDDFIYIEGVHTASLTCTPATGRNPVQLRQTPQLVPVSTQMVTTAAGLQAMQPTGMGFGIYLNGERYIVQTSALPTSGTWTHRSYSGFVTASVAPETTNPSGYAFRSLLRPPVIPGLTMVFEVEQASVITDATDLKRVHTVPDPYYAVSQFDLGPTTKELQFVNLPPAATIRIYSLAGVLVDVINHNDEAGRGMAPWNLRNRSNQFVASGVYLFHVSTPDGRSEIGKFTVINSGIAR